MISITYTNIVVFLGDINTDINNLKKNTILMVDTISKQRVD